MSILTSTAVGSELDVLGTGLQASESCIAIGLEDGSLRTFDARGQPMKAFTADDFNEAAAPQRFRAFSVVGNKLIVGKKRSGTNTDATSEYLEVIDVVTSKTLTSIGISEQPKKIISYHDREFDYVIASPHGAHVQLIVLSPSSSGRSEVKTITATADIPSFKIFKHHMAQSILALLSARDGIVQLWQLSALKHNDMRLITNLCTIYSVKEGEDLSLIPPDDSKKISTHKIFSILVHSSGCVLTGHEDGKIKVWDYSLMLSDDMTLDKQDDRSNGKTLTKPVFTIRNSIEGYLVNGLLEVCYQTDSNINSCDIVSTDTDGVVRLWRFLDHSSSSNNFQLSLVGQHKLFRHSVLCRAITNNGWLVAGGKEGENEDNNACGSHTQVKMLNLASLLNGDSHSSVEVRELGSPSLAVWDLKIVNSLQEDGSQHVVVSMMRRGRAWLEVWVV